MTLALERMGREHRELADDFENDVPELVTYLRRWALAHQERDRLSRTWLAIDDVGERRIAGYFSLALSSLERGLAAKGDIARLPHFPVPGILLARLAVDRRVQGQGVGTWMFDETLRMTLGLAVDGPAAVRVLITDAKNEEATRFYERRGLMSLTETGWPRRMVLDLKPLIARR